MSFSESFSAILEGSSRYAIAAILVVVSNAPSKAENSCASAHILAKHVESSFSTFDPSTEQNKLGNLLDTAASCALSLKLSGERELICSWQYDYRSASATKRFVRINAALTQCLGDTQTLKKDKEVNHPDFYDLRIYKIDNADFRISLKDKAALDQTYLFLRVGKSDKTQK